MADEKEILSDLKMASGTDIVDDEGRDLLLKKVDTFSNLPEIGESDGDSYLVLDIDRIYEWDNLTQKWILNKSGWLPPVDIFSDIVIKYPNPNNGDSVFVISEEKIYQYIASLEVWRNTSNIKDFISHCRLIYGDLLTVKIQPGSLDVAGNTLQNTEYIDVGFDNLETGSTKKSNTWYYTYLKMASDNKLYEAFISEKRPEKSDFNGVCVVNTRIEAEHFALTGLMTEVNSSASSGKYITTAPDKVSLLGSWVNGTTVALQAGRGRALIVIATNKGTGVLSSLTYGGRPMTKIIEHSITDAGITNYLGAYILNEENIKSAVGTTLVPTWVGTTNGIIYSSGFYQGVEQDTPVSLSEYNSSLTSSVYTNSLTNVSGDVIINAVLNSNAAAVLSLPVEFTQVASISGGNADALIGSVETNGTAIAAGGSSTGAGRMVTLGIVLKNNPQGASKKASYTYTGTNGTFNIKLKYFDINSGQATYKLYKNEILHTTWIANANLGANIDATTLTFKLIEDITLQTNDIIDIELISNSTEYGYLDVIELQSVAYGAIARYHPTLTARFVGSFKTDNNQDIVKFKLIGNKVYYIGTGINYILQGGTASIKTAVNCRQFVPLTSDIVLIYYNLQTGAATRYIGDSESWYFVMSSGGAGNLELPVSEDSIFYQGGVQSISLGVSAYYEEV